MVDRYAAETFACYGSLRRLSPTQPQAELELFDDLVLIKGLRPGEAGRWIVTGAGDVVPPPPIGGWCVPTWL